MNTNSKTPAGDPVPAAAFGTKVAAAKGSGRVTIHGKPVAIELEELGFQEIAGFLKRPDDADATPTALACIVHGFVPPKNTKSKGWYVVEAVGDQPHAIVRDEENGETAVTDGLFLGVSNTGAIYQLERKLGHYVELTWTGEKKPTNSGNEMWEVLCRVSKRPVVEPQTSRASAASNIPTPF